MKRPLSIHSRLLAAAIVTTLVALAITGWSLQREIVHVISQNLSAKIDTQIGMIERGIAADGRPQLDRIQFLHDFERPETDWGWRLQTRAGRWTGGIAFGPATFWADFPEEREGAVNARAQGAGGEPLYVRMRRSANGSVEVAVPMEMLNVTLRPAMRTMLVGLAALAAVLVAATLLQLRFGLKPLHALRSDLEHVRRGDAHAVTRSQPSELLPLTEEVNALIAQNAAGLANARSHVANLAHGLKTPLATLSLMLTREGASAKALSLVADLDRRIDHHLGRARAAAVSAGERARADASEVAAALAPALLQLHVGHELSMEVALPASLQVGVDRQDLDEMLGNLLDNAARHARSKVRLSGAPQDRLVRLIVEDDGPGIPEDAVRDAIRAGTRLDEGGRGYGFGLGIVRELSELYGGALTLGHSRDLGGLCATLQLPLR